MGRVLLAFITLSTVFSMLHAVAGDSPEILRDNPLNLRPRTLLPKYRRTEQIAADPPEETGRLLSGEDESASAAAAEAPAEGRRMGRHHSSDKSAAGGGVIIGGLVTAIFAAVFCYIRVTRRRHAETFK